MSLPVKFINHTKSAIPSLLSKHSKLSPSFIRQVQAASHVYPFRANNYVVENLINWDNVPEDPIFRLTFPQPEMLHDADMQRVLSVMDSHGGNDAVNRDALRHEAVRIRQQLNPHPAKQKEMNVPSVIDATDGKKKRVPGAQHKYRETLLFFPSEAQWCHSYCTYCFRWAQFSEVGSEQQFKSKDVSMLTQYIAENKQLTDILFTGGDPGVMKTAMWKKYLLPLIDPANQKELGHLNTIRIGTKSLTYWPYRYTHNEDADELLKLLEACTNAGKHVTIQAHFTHPQELSTPQVEAAIRRLRMTGANIRSQAPIVRGINDDAAIWEEMWRRQTNLGIIPYYMFIERDTGPKHYFELPLVRAYQVFKEAVSRVSGVARTVRGPSMSCEPGKVAVMGVIGDMMILQFLQARNPKWMENPFLAKMDANATWLDQLKPYDGSQKFFWQKELDDMINFGMSSGQMDDKMLAAYNAKNTNNIQVAMDAASKLTPTKKYKLSSMPNGNVLQKNGIGATSNGRRGDHQQKKSNPVLVHTEQQLNLREARAQ